MVAFVNRSTIRRISSDRSTPKVSRNAHPYAIAPKQPDPRDTGVSCASVISPDDDSRRAEEVRIPRG
jgi:hypothetical protein